MRDGGKKKKKKGEQQASEAEWKRAGPLTSRTLSASLSTFLSLFSPSFLSLRRISPNPPITVMSGWERGSGGGEERLCVTGSIDGGGGREGGGLEGGDSSPLFICYECHSSPDPALIGQWRLTARTRCRDPECSLLSYRLCESWWEAKWPCGLKWKCHSKAPLIQSTFSRKPCCSWADALLNSERRTP